MSVWQRAIRREIGMFTLSARQWIQTVGMWFANALGMNNEPFALQLYRRFLTGETIAQLSTQLGIPADRIETRIRAAAVYFGRHHSCGELMEEWQTWA